jgi:acyl-CoA thioesterase-1
MLKNTLYLAVTLFILSSCGGTTSQKAETITKDSLSVSDSTQKKNILFFGNSLTAGLGVEPEEAFPALIGYKIDSLNLPYKITNAGLSGETTAAGKARVNWILKQQVDVFVLELGANDGLRGIPVSETQKNLQDIVDQVRAKYPEAKLVMTGMQVPPNMGAKYASDFRVIFKQLADKNDMALVPFLLEKVGGVSNLNQSDGIHPTPEGHRILAENVWEVLEGIL